MSWQRLPPEFLVGCHEHEWQFLVKQFAEAHGWECYHTLDSRGSDPGFPDLVMAKIWENGYWAEMVHAELKREGGVQTEAQKRWEKLIKTCGGHYYLWYPRDWEEVQRVLSR